MSDMASPRYPQAKSPWLSVLQLGFWFSIAALPAVGKEPAAVPPTATVETVGLIEQHLVKMGTIGSHPVSVALENLYDKDSLGYLKEQVPTGYVISLFVNDYEPREFTEGELARAFRSRLASVSPKDSERLGKFLEELPPKKPGDVVGFSLGLSKDQRSQFPVDRLIIVIFLQGHSSETLLDRGTMVEVLADAEREHLAALVVPAIGHRWQEKHSLAFADVFQPLFKALAGAKPPMEVFVSLYSNWPSFVIEDAVSALNRSWPGLAATSGGLPPPQNPPPSAPPRTDVSAINTPAK